MYKSLVLLLGTTLDFGFYFEQCSRVVVEDDSEGGTGIFSELLHLFSELAVVFGREVLHSLSEGGHLADENEHVLSEVLGQLGHEAVVGVGEAHLGDVDDGLLEAAGCEVLEDLRNLSEHVEVLLNVAEVAEGSDGVGDEATELGHVLDGLLVEAGILALGQGLLIEGLVVAIIEALETFDAPHHVGLLDGRGSLNGGNGSESEELHFSKN